MNNKEDISGILLLNKETGISSQQALSKVKRLFNAKKAGHTGSLDPLATGMLPICFGESTKFAQYLLDEDKCYTVTAQLGVKTDTGDAEGVFLSPRKNIQLTKQDILNTLNHFKGEIRQIPPMYSALKFKGKALYHYARKGITIERKERLIQIHSLTLDDFSLDHMTLTVRCSKGTYIRTLVEDIGDMLGVGAYVSALHRNYVASFIDEEMYTQVALEKLSLEQRRALFIPIDKAIAQIPKVVLENDDLIKLYQGQMSTTLHVTDHADNEGLERDKVRPISSSLVRIHSIGGDFIGLGDNQNGVIKAKRLLAASLHFDKIIKKQTQ